MAINAKQWKEKYIKPREVILPTKGEIITVRSIDIQTFITQGFIPLTLLQTLATAETQIKKNREEGRDELDGIEDDDIKKIDLLARKVAVKAVTEPKLTMEEKSTDEFLSVYEIPFYDCMFIFNECVSEGAREFRPFL